MADRSSPAQALAIACPAVGLDSAGAEVVHERANTVFKLAGVPVVARVRYTRGSDAWMERLTASVKVTGWLHEHGFPTVRPADVQQPVEADGYLVTFWHFVEAIRAPWEDVESLGRLLRRLHSIETPPIRLPAASPLGSMPEDTSRLIQGGDGVLLGDWDSVSCGPREQDIVPTSIRYRFGRPAAEWDRFCTAYGVDPGGLPGLGVLREMREVRTLVPYIRSTERPAAQAEATRRIDDLMSGRQREPWTALNLAS